MGDLDQDGRAAPTDEQAATGGQRRRLVAAEQRALVRVAAHDQTGHAKLAQALEHRLEATADDAGDGAREHQVEAELLAVGKQVEQRCEQTARHGGEQVLVVDQDDLPRVMDGRRAGRLVTGDRPAGQAGGQPGAKLLDHLRGGARVGGVSRKLGQPGEVEEAAPVVNDHQGDLVGPVAGGQTRASRRSRLVLPHSAPPRTRKCGGRYQFSGRL